MTENILDFIKIFDGPELHISIIDNIINFTKGNDNYNVKLTKKQNNIMFTSYDTNINNIHFSNILNSTTLLNIHQIPELIEFIIQLNLNNYCVVCQEKLDFQSEQFVSCGKPNCLYKYEELIVGNAVIEKVKDDSEKCKFLLESAIDAIGCERKYDIFEPFPQHFLKYEIDGIERGTVSKLSGKNYDDAKNFTLIAKTLNGINIDTVIKLIKSAKTDIELSEILGKDLYILVRFILMSCKVDISKNDDVLGLKSDKFKIYKITHPIDKEEEFKQISNKTQTSFIFHGSRWCNWYSILRNGLKNCSKTKLMTAGAAHGNGIYLSDDINLSFGYGLSNDKSIVGVFELIDKPKYHKSGTIYVVEDEKVLIQRYLLIIPSSHKNDFFKDINSIFNKTIHEDKINSSAKYNKKSIAKIVREYQILSKMDPDKSNFRIDVNPNYPFEWKIFISKFDEKLPIAQDMKKFGIGEIELEIKFPENYPFSPPFLRIVSPRFMHLTGHIVANGAICNEVLTEKGWSPIFSIESLIVLITSEIIEGGGRLDPNKYNIPYSYEAAKADFIRVAKSHGWI